jgi:hypothetical protein
MDVVLKNKRNRKICINFQDGSYKAILAEGKTKISEKNLASPHLQAFVARGDVVVIREVKAEAEKKPEKKKEGESSYTYRKGDEKKEKEETEEEENKI